jgi:hypothetical protein
VIRTYDPNEKYHCHRCETGLESEDRYSFGVYAGRWCDVCWLKSGYRDAVDHSVKFDPSDAGESINCETVEEDREWGMS